MEKIKRILVAKPFAQWLLVLSAMAGLSAAVAEDQVGPVEMLQGLSARLIEIADSQPGILDKPQELRRVADEVVLPHVDFVMLSRRVLGRHWRTATAAQQESFISEFRELLLGTYLRSVSEYKGNTIRFLPLREDRQRDHVRVNVLIEQKNGPPVHAAFRLHMPGNEWLIYDVIVEGISLVATHRSTFTQIIHNHGLDSLIERLRERNAINSKEAAAGTR